MSTTTNTTPYLRRYRLVTGTDWEGVKLRELDGSGDPILTSITCAAQVRTAPTALGGEKIADCTVSSIDGSGYFTVTLPAATTATFPIRQLFLDVKVTVSGVVKVPVQVVLDVTGDTWAAA